MNINQNTSYNKEKLENMSFRNNCFHWNSKTIWRRWSSKSTDKHAAVMTQTERWSGKVAAKPSSQLSPCLLCQRSVWARPPWETFRRPWFDSWRWRVSW